MDVKHTAKQILIAIDQLWNALMLGWADETFSARSWRLRTISVPWNIAQLGIDLLFKWQSNSHCEEAYDAEKARAHMPVEYRNVPKPK